MKKFCVSVVLALTTSNLLSQVNPAKAYSAKPKLLVLIVIEQLRGDYLGRDAAVFNTPHGFNLFLQHGAYFPQCYFEYANTVTASGHATIATGAYTDGHNIASDQWWDLDRSKTRPVTAVEDARYPLVGTTSDQARGASPQNELASTLGDEVVLATAGRSKLFGISLKDSEAILLSGHASTGAYWIDRATGRFITSTYWSSSLPTWVEEFNRSGRAEQARREANALDGPFYDRIGKDPSAVRFELDFAKALVAAERLGQHGTTDVLTISLPQTDFLGHQVGPDSPEQKRLLEAIDESLNNFFDWLNAHVDGGLGNVWIALTGDHGVAPSPSAAAGMGMPSASFSGASVEKELNRELNARLSPQKEVPYILGEDLPYIRLDERAFEAAGKTEAQSEELVASILPAALLAVQPKESGGAQRSRSLQTATVRYLYTKRQIAAGALPDTPRGKRILNSFSTNGGWWVMMVPGMYQMEGHEVSGTTHDSPYSYDRHVPLAFYGRPFRAGTYLEKVEPVDMATTLAALLGVNQPSSAVGRVLTEALSTSGAPMPKEKPHVQPTDPTNP
jgi:hypothetical protein